MPTLLKAKLGSAPNADGANVSSRLENRIVVPDQDRMCGTDVAFLLLKMIEARGIESRYSNDFRALREPRSCSSTWHREAVYDSFN
jgi:hypothetical protein